MSSCRICARCGGLGVYSLGAPRDKVVRAGCEVCGWVARLRPICDDWDGSWSLDGEDDEVSDPASDDVGSPSPPVGTSPARPSVAGTLSPDDDEDSGPWCPKCEGDVEDDEVGGERAYWCPTCKSLYPTDEVLTPDSPQPTNHGGDSVAADGGPVEADEDVDVVDLDEEGPEDGLWRWSE